MTNILTIELKNMTIFNCSSGLIYNLLLIKKKYLKGSFSCLELLNLDYLAQIFIT